MELEKPSRRGGEKVPQRPQATSESSEETETNECRSGEFQRSGVLEKSYPVLATSIVLETNSVLEPASHSLAESSDVPNSGKIESPRPYDVLFGRGKPYQIHKGNRRLHRIVAAHKPRYLKSKQNKKCEIAKMILRLVKEGNSEPVRFLRREGYFWVEVPYEVAREKVSHALRCRTKKIDPPDDPSRDGILIYPPFAGRPLMGAPPLSIPTGTAFGNRPRLLSAEQPKPCNTVSAAPAVLPAAIYMNSALLPMASPPSWGHFCARPGPAMGGFLGIRLPAPESYVPRMVGVPYGLQTTMSRGPRGYSDTPVGMLSDNQILGALLQRRQARTFVPDRRPQFFPPFS